jgi:hypothetical protein
LFKSILAALQDVSRLVSSAMEVVLAPNVDGELIRVAQLSREKGMPPKWHCTSANET